jgi:sugar phosphate isomerase/epimerase
MWMQHRFARLADFVSAARALGFGGVEISHIVTPGMIGDADVSQLGAWSVHFPAPAVPSPYGGAAEALLSSTDGDGRRWAVAQGFASIDLAVKAGARAVCLHLGEVTTSRHLEWALEQRYKGGQKGTPAYAVAQQLVEIDRQQGAAAALAAAQQSLEELSNYARPRGVRLGIESRVSHWQIPTFDELGVLLSGSDPEVVGFWYDCGHVQVLDNLGFHHHQDWLDAYGSRIVGVHWHDVLGLRDHLLPGLGELDFAALARALPADAVLTCELDWYYGPDEIVQGARQISRCLR